MKKTITLTIYRYYNKNNKIVRVLTKERDEATEIAKYDKMAERYGWTKTIGTETRVIDDTTHGNPVITYTTDWNEAFFNK